MINFLKKKVISFEQIDVNVTCKNICLWKNLVFRAVKISWN